MRKLTKHCLLVGAVAMSVSLAVAQVQPYVTGYSTGGYYGGAYPYYGGYGYGYGYGPGVGSTAAGSYMAGLSQAIRAQGQYNALSSEAAINLEEAKKKEIENRLRGTNAYYEMRKMNEAYRQSQKPPVIPPDEWARQAQQEVPDRLPSTLLDPVTGAIHWPDALTTPQFEAQRQQIDVLFADRAAVHGAIGLEAHRQIRNTLDGMINELKDSIRQYDPQVYLQAKNFLLSLRYEADFPIG